MYTNKERIIEDYKEILQVLTDTSALDEESGAQQNECTVVLQLIQKSVEENARIAQDQDEYNKRYASMLERYETAKARLEKITEEKQARMVKCECILRFISGLERFGSLLEEFDEGL